MFNYFVENPYNTYIKLRVLKGIYEKSGFYLKPLKDRKYIKYYNISKKKETNLFSKKFFVNQLNTLNIKNRIHNEGVKKSKKKKKKIDPFERNFFQSQSFLAYKNYSYNLYHKKSPFNFEKKNLKVFSSKMFLKRRRAIYSDFFFNYYDLDYKNNFLLDYDNKSFSLNRKNYKNIYDPSSYYHNKRLVLHFLMKKFSLKRNLFKYKKKYSFSLSTGLAEYNNKLSLNLFPISSYKYANNVGNFYFLNFNYFDFYKIKYFYNFFNFNGLQVLNYNWKNRKSNINFYKNNLLFLYNKSNSLSYFSKRKIGLLKNYSFRKIFYSYSKVLNSFDLKISKLPSYLLNHLSISLPSFSYDKYKYSKGLNLQKENFITNKNQLLVNNKLSFPNFKNIASNIENSKISLSKGKTFNDFFFFSSYVVKNTNDSLFLFGKTKKYFNFSDDIMLFIHKQLIHVILVFLIYNCLNYKVKTRFLAKIKKNLIINFNDSKSYKFKNFKDLRTKNLFLLIIIFPMVLNFKKKNNFFLSSFLKNYYFF